jgi:hypothetical protein
MPDPEAQPCKYMTLERQRSRELASRKHGDADFPTREALAETLLQVAKCWECPEIASIAIGSKVTFRPVKDEFACTIFKFDTTSSPDSVLIIIRTSSCIRACCYGMRVSYMLQCHVFGSSDFGLAV